MFINVQLGRSDLSHLKRQQVFSEAVREPPWLLHQATACACEANIWREENLVAVCATTGASVVTLNEYTQSKHDVR